MNQHETWMRRALELAQRAEGETHPNPMVGAVLVKDGRLIGEGWHRRAGTAHAEVACLAAATESPQGATIYVTLEPCCHHGRTPPCTDALIAAGVAVVYYAVGDANPRVAGRGHHLLTQAGIEVHGGLLEAEARFLNRAFFTYITQQRSYVVAKYAMSLDGRIATASGESQWITGEVARQQGHHLRHLSDAIIVGMGTVRADNPRLTTRLAAGEGRHPLRIVLDSQGDLPVAREIFSGKLPAATLLATTASRVTERQQALQGTSVEVLELPADERGRPQIGALLNALAARQLMRVMVEGGAQVLGSFLDAHLIDEVWAFLGPSLIGGAQAPGPFAGKGTTTLRAAPRLDIYDVQRPRNDVLIRALVRAVIDP